MLLFFVVVVVVFFVVFFVSVLCSDHFLQMTSVEFHYIIPSLLITQFDSVLTETIL